ncbi:MAG: hypothetical protein RTU92_00465 [Candidatus Thorarchaeota archaeon]
MDERRVRMEYLGKIVTDSNGGKFEELVRSTVKSGVVDITGWTVTSVKILLTVCREEELTITLKNGDRYSTPVRYPDGPMFDVLVKTVMNGT